MVIHDPLLMVDVDPGRQITVAEAMMAVVGDLIVLALIVTAMAAKAEMTDVATIIDNAARWVEDVEALHHPPRTCHHLARNLSNGITT